MVAAAAAAAARGGWNISVMTQLPNSPDFNVLNLGFLNSIQSLLKYKKQSKGIDHLIANVEEAFGECKYETLKWFSCIPLGRVSSVLPGTK